MEHKKNPKKVFFGFPIFSNITPTYGQYIAPYATNNIVVVIPGAGKFAENSSVLT
jgi:hypothetical protein